MKKTISILSLAVFASCSTPNKEVLPQILDEVTPEGHLLFTEDSIARKPIIIFTEKDFC
tara:strand:+ start:174 stop:350 length:177 start_codon:yes stop_codon:yes gene_type:complete